MYLKKNQLFINQNPIQTITKVPQIQRKPICPCGGGCSACTQKIQTKLKVSHPNDPYEQEADRISKQVLRIPSDSISKTDSQIQRKYSTRSDNEDLKISRKSSSSGGMSVSDNFSIK